MKVLLTGAFGNIGRYTALALLADGHDVVAFDLATPRARRAAARLDPRVRVTWGDVTDPASLGAALAGAEAVVHLAAILVPDAAPERARRVNVEATRDLIAQMEASPAAKRLVFASSQAIFGDVQDREPPLRVETPVRPCNEYGRHKVACEEAIRRSRLRWTLLRLAVVPPTRLLGYAYGPRQIFEFSADARIEFVHPADAATAFARAVSCEESVGKTLYVGGGERCRMTHRDFSNELMDPIGIGPLPADAFVRTPVPRLLGDWVDTAESQRLLRYQQRALPELKADMSRALGPLTPLVRMLRPVVNRLLVRQSPYVRENRRADSAGASRTERP